MAPLASFLFNLHIRLRDVVTFQGRILLNESQEYFALADKCCKVFHGLYYNLRNFSSYLLEASGLQDPSSAGCHDNEMPLMHLCPVQNKIKIHLLLPVT